MANHNLNREDIIYDLQDEILAFVLIKMTRNICFYCETTNTPMFRKANYDKDNIIKACNACGLRGKYDKNFCDSCGFIKVNDQCRWCNLAQQETF